MVVRFGQNTFDGEQRLLLKGGEPVRLSPKAFRLLEHLLERRPKAVSKAELQLEVWPDVIVSEENLAIRINEVRRAIGDNPRKPLFIRTVYRFGYAFIGDASSGSRGEGAPAGGFQHRLTWGTDAVDLSEGENVLGRDSGAAVWIGDSSVSRRHARILVAGASATLEDLRSKNGTLHNDTRIKGSASLKDGDEIRIGSVTMTFRSVSVGASTETKSGLDEG